MNRRSFVVGSATAVATLATPLGNNKTDHEMEIELLEDFLKPSNSGVSREEITGLMAIIQQDGDTIARATHIGDGYYLTNYHVIEDKSNLSINMQNPWLRSIVDKPFTVLNYDKSEDLALIHVSGTKKTGKASVHLRANSPQVNDEVSYFLLIARPAENSVEQPYHGIDFYDGKTPFVAGKVVMTQGSRLIEERGTVVAYHPEKLLPGQRTRLPQGSFFATSLLAYNGRSGTGTFTQRKNVDGTPSVRYDLNGIIAKASGFSNYISTPNHPLHDEARQVMTSVANPSSIRKLVLDYLRNGQRNIS